MGRDIQWEANPPPLDPRLYRVSFTKAAWSVGCPVEFCKGWAMTRTNLRIHFVSHHVRYMIVII